MSLKNKPSPGRLSITTRLTLLYTFSVFGILSIAVVVLYWTLIKNIETENYKFLADKIHILRHILQEHSDKPEVLEGEVKWERRAYQFTEFFARILDEHNHILLETEGMDDTLLTPRSFPPPFATDESPGKARRFRTHDGRHYLLMAAWAEVGQAQGANGGFRLIQAALDVSHESALITRYRRTIAIVLFCGVFFSVMAGLIIARRGMRPVEEIASAARRITAAHLNERIEPAKWPRELMVLAGAFDSMLDRLEDSFTRLSRFSADVAHEMRTPINNLRGETEVTLSRARSSEEYRQALESNLEEFERLSRMIESLLFLARAERQDLTLEKSAFDPIAEIAPVLEYYSAMAEEKGITITSTRRGSSLLHADPTLFRRAVSNLVSNALRYTPNGGTVTVSVEQADDGAVKISVSDTGFGIDAEDLPKVFDRLYRADRARSQHPQGAGLGLSIVKSIMDFHRGTVSIRSEPHKGTTVSLIFPRLIFTKL